jgi:hypothetical protein
MVLQVKVLRDKRKEILAAHGNRKQNHARRADDLSPLAEQECAQTSYTEYIDK